MVGAGLGLLVVGAALGFGELVAGLTRATSPVVTVGDALVDNSPSFLMEWAISLFGTADKAVLIAGVVVVLILAGALLGVVSLRRPAVGYAGLLLFTAAGLAAVLAAPDAVTTSAEPMEDVSVTVVHSESLGDLVFSAHGLEDLHDEDYQLWLTRPDGSVYSAGLLAVDEEGFVLPILATPQDGETDGVAVTVEPEGGPDQPTSDPVMAMPVTG